MIVDDANTKPPGHMKSLFKRWQKASVETIDNSSHIIDFAKYDNIEASQFTREVVSIGAKLSQLFCDFLQDTSFEQSDDLSRELIRFEVKALPGLYVYPNLLPEPVQAASLDKLLHRDLSNQSHMTNLHLHYNIPYPRTVDNDRPNSCDELSFFRMNQAELLTPRDPAIHKPLTIRQMLERKLRWITLGGQYDWTAKVYPPGTPPEFPRDIKLLLKGMFSEVDAEAAIVNFYTPGDTLSVHRDVSEECDKGLISMSIGCDGLFIIGNDQEDHSVTLRLHSGDVVLMSGDSRFAWHAVPRILPHTCPAWIRSWPTIRPDNTLEHWRGWIENKRININVRQMQDPA